METASSHLQSVKNISGTEADQSDSLETWDQGGNKRRNSKKNSYFKENELPAIYFKCFSLIDTNENISFDLIFYYLISNKIEK